MAEVNHAAEIVELRQGPPTQYATNTIMGSTMRNGMYGVRQHVNTVMPGV